MLNHTYTLLLNLTYSDIPYGTTTLRLVDPDFRALVLPKHLYSFQVSLYADCNTLLARQERAESYLALVTTPELMPYTLKFDTRNTYERIPNTLLSMCTTDKTASISASQLEQIDTAVRTCPTLFSLPVQVDDMDVLRRTYYSATDRHIAAGAALLAYVYQLEYVRRV
jgi:hypothetical protein